MPQGLGLYVRRIKRSRHGTPAEFADKCAAHGLGWMAIAGPWHDARGQRSMNDPRTVRRYLDALAERDVEPFVWGYPWQGTEREFVEEMRRCAGDHRRGLLDSERGANPVRSKARRHMERAEDHAKLLVETMAEQGFDTCGLSSYGSGVRSRWFPMEAFVHSLLDHFAGRGFVGGQTYTEDRRVDPSMEDYLSILEETGARRGPGGDIELVPNFGLYDFVKRDPDKPLRGSNRKAVRKKPDELLKHLSEFIDEAEPVYALIGWAENFVTARTWAVLQRFGGWMERGACTLPAA